MKISIIGCGYVGAVTGICFADLGNEIYFVDIDNNKIKSLNSGKIPLFEPDLEELLTKNKHLIQATDNLNHAINSTEVTFICVGTPSQEDGSIDTRYIKSASEDIGSALKRKKNFHSVVVKSTVVPGTTEEIVLPSIEEHSGKVSDMDFGIAMNPEFLKEGDAVNDFFHPDRIVLGVRDKITEKKLESIYSQFSCKKLITNIKTAEMIKYASNACLATKISYANEIGNICKKIGIDSYHVFEGVGLDSRINPKFFRCGIGFGGSCFPKDVHALISYARSLDVDTPILNSVIHINDNQPLMMIKILKKYIPDLSGKSIGILGLAFKPDTDDIRESRAIPLIIRLQQEGAIISVFDPLAMTSFRTLYPEINYVDSAKDILNTDAVLIVTEWAEFYDLDYSGMVVIDGRRIEKAREKAKIYEGVCW
jgi:UDPglucose 6-dehydrogenase